MLSLTSSAVLCESGPPLLVLGSGPLFHVPNQPTLFLPALARPLRDTLALSSFQDLPLGLCSDTYLLSVAGHYERRSVLHLPPRARWMRTHRAEPPMQ